MLRRKNRAHSAVEIKKICLDAGADDMWLVDLDSKYLGAFFDPADWFFDICGRHERASLMRGPPLQLPG